MKQAAILTIPLFFVFSYLHQYSVPNFIFGTPAAHASDESSDNYDYDIYSSNNGDTTGWRNALASRNGNPVQSSDSPDQNSWNNWWSNHRDKNSSDYSNANADPQSDPSGTSSVTPADQAMNNAPTPGVPNTGVDSPSTNSTNSMSGQTSPSTTFSVTPPTTFGQTSANTNTNPGLTIFPQSSPPTTPSSSSAPSSPIDQVVNQVLGSVLGLGGNASSSSSTPSTDASSSSSTSTNVTAPATPSSTQQTESSGQSTSSQPPLDLGVPSTTPTNPAPTSSDTTQTSTATTVPSTDNSSSPSNTSSSGNSASSTSDQGTATPPSEPVGSIFDTGGVSFRFDDGWQSQYDVALPALQKAGIAGTFYIITHQMKDQGFSGFMTIAEVKQMAADGEEIGAHTQTHPHLSTLTVDQQTQEIDGSKSDLQSWGLNPLTFSYPYGEYTTDTVQIVKDAGFTSAVTTAKKPVLPTSDRLQIESPSIQDTDTVASIEQMIQNAVSKHEWLIMTFHRIDASGDQYSITPQNFQAVVDYVHQNQIPTVTVSQGAANLAQR